jgi:hypothetical protein
MANLHIYLPDAAFIRLHTAAADRETSPGKLAASLVEDGLADLAPIIVPVEIGKQIVIALDALRQSDPLYLRIELSKAGHPLAMKQLKIYLCQMWRDGLLTREASGGIDFAYRVSDSFRAQWAAKAP